MTITPIQLAKRVEAWGKRLSALGVAHFEITHITVGHESPSGSSDAKASVVVHDLYDSCSFFFDQYELDRMDENELDMTIIHEWLHVAFRDWEAAVSACEDWLPARTFEDFEGRLNHEREGLIDRLARAMFQLYSGNPARFSP